MAISYKTHSKFLITLHESSKLFLNDYSAIPTYIFLLSSCLFTYEHIHRTTTKYTKVNTRLIRDLKFHWTYFTITRLWFMLLSCLQRLINVADDYIEVNIAKEDHTFLKMVTHLSGLFVYLSLSIIPFFLLYLHYLPRYDMENFLMWVMEDPYIRHEIGISGRCLEHPSQPQAGKLQNYYFRSKRSTSFDNNLWLKKKPIICRSCKSMMDHHLIG